MSSMIGLMVPHAKNEDETEVMTLEKHANSARATLYKADRLGVQLAYLDLLIRALVEHEKRLDELVRNVIPHGDFTTTTHREEALLC
jgi:hypothetical protein